MKKAKCKHRGRRVYWNTLAGFKCLKCGAEVTEIDGVKVNRVLSSESSSNQPRTPADFVEKQGNKINWENEKN